MGSRADDRGQNDSARRYFAQVVHEHGPALYRYAYWLCRESAQAEDLVQETFLRGWRNWESLRDPDKVKNWLYTTLRREHARQFERQRPPLADIDPDTCVAPRGGPRSDLDELRDAILSLPATRREVLALQVLGGYSGAEIGQMLGLPRATVNTRLFRARMKLKRRLLGQSATSDEPTPGGAARFRRRR